MATLPQQMLDAATNRLSGNVTSQSDAELALADSLTGLLALTGPAVRQALTNLRAGTFGLEWRAIRVETVQRVEAW